MSCQTSKPSCCQRRQKRKLKFTQYRQTSIKPSFLGRQNIFKKKREIKLINKNIFSSEIWVRKIISGRKNISDVCRRQRETRIIRRKKLYLNPSRFCFDEKLTLTNKYLSWDYEIQWTKTKALVKYKFCLLKTYFCSLIKRFSNRIEIFSVVGSGREKFFWLSLFWTFAVRRFLNYFFSFVL